MEILRTISARLPQSYRGSVSSNLLARIALSIAAPAGDSTIGQLVLHAGAEAALEIVAETHLSRKGTVGSLTQGGPVWGESLAQAVKVSLETACALGLTVLDPEHAAWPRQVDDLRALAPLALWTTGDLGTLSTPRLLSVVCNRTSTLAKRKESQTIVAELAELGFTIASPATFGPDLEMLATANLAGANFVIVCAGGLDKLANTEAGELFRTAAPGRALAISESAPGIRTDRTNSLQRHRLLAALSPTTVMLGADTCSEALLTAGFALELNRQVASCLQTDTTAGSAASTTPPNLRLVNNSLDIAFP